MIDWKKVKDINENLFKKILENPSVLERVKEETEMYKKAKSFGLLKKDLEPIYKQFKDNFFNNKSITFNNQVSLKSCGYSIKNDSIYNPNDKLVIKQLIYPSEVYKNVNTGIEKVRVCFKGKKWESRIFDRETLMTSSKISRLSGFGIRVTSTNAKMLPDYFNDILNENTDIPLIETTDQLGWYGNDGFIPYCNDVVLDSIEDKSTNVKFKQIWNSLKEYGDYEEWKKNIDKSREKLATRLLMGASVASVLLSKLGKNPFVVYVYGLTDAGKSYACECAMSIWGNPAKKKLMNIFNGTENGILTIASLCKDIPVYFDEFQTVDQNKFDVNKFLMNFSEGMERVRGNVDGKLQESKTWDNVLICCGEENISTTSLGGGTLNRLIEIYVDEKLVDSDGVQYNILHNNYGFAGKKIINYIKKIGFEEIDNIFNEKYQKILNLGKSASKQSINMAMIWTGDEIFRRCISPKEKELTLQQIQRNMFTKREIDQAENVYDFVIEKCNMNINHFKIKQDDPMMNNETGWTGNGEIWGTADSFCYRISKVVLEQLLKEKNAKMKIICKTWEKRGYIERASSNRLDVHTTINNQSVNLITLKRSRPPKIEDEQEKLKKKSNEIINEIKKTKEVDYYMRVN